MKKEMKKKEGRVTVPVTYYIKLLKDSKRLDWLQKNKPLISYFELEPTGFIIDGRKITVKRSIRESIDQAIKSESKGGKA